MLKTKYPVAHAALIFIGLSLSACIKGKDCEQLYQYTLNVENRTTRNLTLELVDQLNEPLSINVLAMEHTNHKVIKESYQTNTGSVQKGGGLPVDAECTSEPVMLGTTIFLSEKSFGVVKYCWDIENSKAIIVENSEPCPDETFQQTKPGFPPPRP